VEFGLADGERPKGRKLRFEIGNHDGLRQRLDFFADRLAGHDTDDARHPGGGLGVDGKDACMRMFAAHEYQRQRVRRLDVAEILAFAGRQAVVFLALDRAADPRASRSQFRYPRLFFFSTVFCR